MRNAECVLHQEFELFVILNIKITICIDISLLVLSSASNKTSLLLILDNIDVDLNYWTTQFF